MPTCIGIVLSHVVFETAQKLQASSPVKTYTAMEDAETINGTAGGV
jgi:hypothetical protein